MPQEPRCAFRPIVTQRAALTVHISQSYLGGIIDNTSSHLVSSRQTIDKAQSVSLPQV